MAETLQVSYGFDYPEHNVNLEHRPGTLATGSCAIVHAPAILPPYGDHCLEITPSKTAAYFQPGDTYTYTVGGITLFAAYVRFSGTFPPDPANPAANILAVLDELNTPFVYMRLDDSGNYKLFDSKNNLLDTRAAFVNVCYKFFILFQPGEAVGDWMFSYSQLGATPARVAGTAFFGGNDAKADFSHPIGTEQGIYLGGQGGNQPVPVGDMDVQFGSGYMMDDVAGFASRIGPREGKPGDFHKVFGGGKITLESITPHCNETGGAPNANDNLTGGTTPDWADAGDGETATPTFCSYTVFPAGFPLFGEQKGGGCRLDAPASEQQDFIYHVTWYWYYRGTLRVVWGEYDGTTYDVSDASAPVSAAVYRYYRVDEDWTGVSRSHLLQAVQGITVVPGKTGYFGEGHFGRLLAVPTVTGRPSKGLTGNVIRGKRPWH